MNQNPLRKIKPAYPHLVKYSQPGEPLPPGPVTQNFNESAYPDDIGENLIDIEENKKWAAELRRAAGADVSEPS